MKKNVFLAKSKDGEYYELACFTELDYATDAYIVETTKDIHRATRFSSLKEIKDIIIHGEYNGIRVGGWFDFEPVSYEEVSVEINVIESGLITE